jgi:hypothetical protein
MECLSDGLEILPSRASVNAGFVAEPNAEPVEVWRSIAKYCE